MEWELNDLKHCYFLVMTCGDVTKRPTILKWWKISKRKQTYITPRYNIGHVCANFIEICLSVLCDSTTDKQIQATPHHIYNILDVYFVNSKHINSFNIFVLGVAN